MGCLGGGGDAKSEFNWSNDMEPFMRAILPQIQAQGAKGYTPYGGQRIAGINGDQNLSMGEIRAINAGIGNMTDQAFNGPNAGSIGAANDAIRQTRGTLSGDYLNGQGSNPYSRGNPYGNANNQYIGRYNNFIDSYNPYATQQNGYVGDSPQFQSMLHQGQQDITDAYQRGTAADTTRLFNLSGAFGGSAHQQAIANNEAALAKNLGTYTAGMQNENYNRSGQLQEADLARQGSQWGQDLSRRGDLLTADDARNMAGQEAQFGRQGGLYESGLNRGSQNYENERNRMVGAIDQGNQQQSLALQRGGALSTIGDFNRGIDQQGLDIGYQNFQDANNWNQNQLGWTMGQYGAAMGGTAMPNQTMQAPGSNWANGLGSALAAYGMFRA